MEVHRISSDLDDVLTCACPECDCTIVEDVFTEEQPVEFYCRSCGSTYKFDYINGDYVYVRT